MFLSCPLFWLIIKLFETYIDGIVKKKNNITKIEDSIFVFNFKVRSVRDQMKVFYIKKKKNIYSSFELK